LACCCAQARSFGDTGNSRRDGYGGSGPGAAAATSITGDTDPGVFTPWHVRPDARRGGGSSGLRFEMVKV
jgi:hypothetical protein